MCFFFSLILLDINKFGGLTSLSFFWGNEPIWLAHHKTKVEIMEAPQDRKLYGKMEWLVLWPTYTDEKGRTLGKTYGMKVRCYWEHIGNLMTKTRLGPLVKKKTICYSVTNTDYVLEKGRSCVVFHGFHHQAQQFTGLWIFEVFWWEGWGP
jgi:hypothetical protein